MKEDARIRGRDLIRDVEPGFSLDSVTCYIGDKYEGLSHDLENWMYTKYIFAAGRRIAVIDSDGVRYFHKDHLGSASIVSDESAENFPEIAIHTPFGEMGGYGLDDGASPARYKFTDQELDIESGLYDYGARLYDPALGRFISPDSILPDMYDPQQLNRYSYVRNNPLKYNDPDGHALHIAVGALIGAAVNMAMNYDDMMNGSMPFGEYCKSAGIGALSGGVAAATGPFGAAAMAGLNEMHEQTIRGKTVGELDLEAVAISTATGYVGSKVGSVAEKIGKTIPKGPFKFKDPSLLDPAPLKPGDFEKIGQVLAEPIGAFVGAKTREDVEEKIRDINSPSNEPYSPQKKEPKEKESDGFNL